MACSQHFNRREQVWNGYGMIFISKRVIVQVTMACLQYFNHKEQVWNDKNIKAG